MPESTRSAVIAVGIALAVVVTPLAAGVAVPTVESAESVESASPGDRAQDPQPVRVEQLSVESVALRNVTVINVVVRELTVRQTDRRENVTLRNVSLARVTVRQAEASGVELRGAVLREETLLSDLGVPYARGANVTNASRQRLSVQNRTFDGVVVENLAVENATGLNVSAPANATESVPVNASTADLVVEDANVSSVASVTASTGNETAAA